MRVFIIPNTPLCTGHNTNDKVTDVRRTAVARWDGSSVTWLASSTAKPAAPDMSGSRDQNSTAEFRLRLRFICPETRVLRRIGQVGITPTFQVVTVIHEHISSSLQPKDQTCNHKQTQLSTKESPSSAWPVGRMNAISLRKYWKRSSSRTSTPSAVIKLRFNASCAVAKRIAFVKAPFVDALVLSSICVHHASTRQCFINSRRRASSKRTARYVLETYKSSSLCIVGCHTHLRWGSLNDVCMPWAV